MVVLWNKVAGLVSSETLFSVQMTPCPVDLTLESLLFSTESTEELSTTSGLCKTFILRFRYFSHKNLVILQITHSQVFVVFFRWVPAFLELLVALEGWFPECFAELNA